LQREDPAGATNMTEPAKELMFRDLPDWLQDRLRDLSRAGFIYVGRTGCGLTHLFRRECMNQGTIKAIDKHMEYHDLEDKILTEMIATEGPRWVPYLRIREYCTTSLYETLRQREPSP